MLCISAANNFNRSNFSLSQTQKETFAENTEVLLALADE